MHATSSAAVGVVFHWPWPPPIENWGGGGGGGAAKSEGAQPSKSFYLHKLTSQKVQLF